MKTMIERFTYEEIIFKTVTDDDGKEINFWSPTIKDNGKIIYDGKDSDEVKNICKLLNQFNNTIDEFVELNHEHLKKITELRNEITELKNKHKEDEFKLHTLETRYTCPHCELNHRQFKYLKSLSERRKQ